MLWIHASSRTPKPDLTSISRQPFSHYLQFLGSGSAKTKPPSFPHPGSPHHPSHHSQTHSRPRPAQEEKRRRLRNYLLTLGGFIIICLAPRFPKKSRASRHGRIPNSRSWDQTTNSISGIPSQIPAAALFGLSCPVFSCLPSSAGLFFPSSVPSPRRLISHPSFKFNNLTLHSLGCSVALLASQASHRSCCVVLL